MSENSAVQQGEAKVRSGKIRAILAGGLVLGVGATVVLAAWNDSEFGAGTFTAGSFNLEGSVDGTAYTDHATAGTAAPLSFTVNPSNLAPGDTVYAPFAVRLDAGTTSPATVTVSSAADGPNSANLSYSVTTPGAFGCSSGDASTVLVPAATPVGTTPAGITFPLAVGTSPAAGAAVNLCFKVTAGANLIESEVSTVTWEFAAASTS